MTTSEQIKLLCIGLSVILKERPPESSVRANGASNIQPYETGKPTAVTMPPAEVPAGPRKS